MNKEDSADDPAELEDRDAGGVQRDPSAASNQWAHVEDEHRAVVEALNRDAVSFTVPSAEGITLYGGIDSHSSNGAIRKLAVAGHLDLVKQVHGERREEAKRDAESQASAEEKPD